MSETQLEDAVFSTSRSRPGLASVLGWFTFHARPAMARNDRWVTAVKGNGAGFPDWVCLRGRRLVVVELKSARGRMSEEQERWAVAWEDVAIANPGVEYYVWRPKDWVSGRIEEVLR